VANFGYWTFGGKNGLKGAPSTQYALPDGRVVTERNPENPAVMPDAHILHALSHSRQARTDYNRLYPDLDQESQNRLDELIAANPRLSSLVGDETAINDAIQRKSVTSGVRTSIKK